MSHNTQCPTCTTVFLVSSEALAAAGGWVRCGRCLGVFDAGAHRYTAIPPTFAVAEHSGPAHLNALDASSPQDDLSTPIEDWDHPRIERRIRRNQEKLNQTIDEVLADSQEEQVDGNLHKDKPQQEQAPLSHVPPPLTELSTQPTVRPNRISVVGFLRWWFAVSLVLLLAGQFVVAYRNTLVLHYPALRPGVGSLCTLIGCEIEGLRELDKIVIETTALRALDSGEGAGKHFQLFWELSNQALYPVQAPALELTLNDALDRPVVRKVLLPSALGLSVPAAVAPEGTWRGEIHLRVNEPDGSAKIAGYRVIAFYP